MAKSDGIMYELDLEILFVPATYCCLRMPHVHVENRSNKGKIIIILIRFYPFSFCERCTLASCVHYFCSNFAIECLIAKLLQHCSKHLWMALQGPKYTNPGKKPSSPWIQKEYNDDGLSGYTVPSLKAVDHRNILFVFMACSVFCRLRSRLSISWA